MAKAPVKIIKPQDGFQTKALASDADIAIIGGAAGPGKTFALLLESVRHTNNKDFGGVIFRRTTPQIKAEGGLWDTSFELYPVCKAQPKETTSEWVFPSGAKMKFSHLEYEKNKLDWQGSQIAFIGWDELTHFTETMFFYLLSRNRSTCGVKPYMRATCNPDPDSWVARLIDWWINPDTGLPLADRDGVIRYFIKYGDNYIWGDSYNEVKEKAAHILEPLIAKSGLLASDFIKSITFINGTVYENKILLASDPSYLANLLSQDEATRIQLLDGNWKMQISDNDIYNYYSFAGVFDNVREVDTTGSYITADIATEGSNKFVVLLWKGWEVMDIEIMDKSDGKEIIDMIGEVAKYWNVQNMYICYDADGVGSFIQGFLRGAQAFHGGSPAREVKDPVNDVKQKENYFNLKTQCFYRSGKRVTNGEIKISEHVAAKMYDDKMTVRQRIMYERKSIKKAPRDNDGKIKMISKKEMAVLLGGGSPDILDAFAQREIFELVTIFKYDDAQY